MIFGNIWGNTDPIYIFLIIVILEILLLEIIVDNSVILKFSGLIWYPYTSFTIRLGSHSCVGVTDNITLLMSLWKNAKFRFKRSVYVLALIKIFAHKLAVAGLDY